MSQQRLTYIDIAKGLLIIGVVFFHLQPMMRDSCGFDSDNQVLLHRLSYLYVPFFMPAFFVITGMCTNFNKPFMRYLWDIVRTIGIPTIVLAFIAALIDWSNNSMALHPFTQYKQYLWGFGLWFLPALACAKTLYWFIHRIPCSIYIKLLGMISLVFMGIWMYDAQLVPNYLYWTNALTLLVAIGFGEWLRMRIVDNRVLWIGTALYICCMIGYECFDAYTPWVMANVHVSFLDVPAYLILSLGGSCLLIGCSKWISSNALLEYVGKGSLVIYALHWVIAMWITKTILCFWQPEWLISIIVLHLFVGIVAIAICCGFVYLLNTKYLCWTLGKFDYGKNKIH